MQTTAPSSKLVTTSIYSKPSPKTFKNAKISSFTAIFTQTEAKTENEWKNTLFNRPETTASTHTTLSSPQTREKAMSNCSDVAVSPELPETSTVEKTAVFDENATRSPSLIASESPLASTIVSGQETQPTTVKFAQNAPKHRNSTIIPQNGSQPPVQPIFATASDMGNQPNPLPPNPVVCEHAGTKTSPQMLESVITGDSGTQTQNNRGIGPVPPPLGLSDQISLKMAPVQSPPPKTALARFDWAEDAAMLPISPDRPPPRDLSSPVPGFKSLPISSATIWAAQTPPSTVFSGSKNLFSAAISATWHSLSSISGTKTQAWTGPPGYSLGLALGGRS
jgi:hypothetical protein